jgi:ABC-type spermidine/putrescine transport system permease subunit II
MTPAERWVHGLLGALMAAVMAILYAPIAMVCVLAFFPVLRGKVDWSSASLAAFVKLLDNQSIVEALLNTLIVGLSTVAVSLVLGLLLAYRASRVTDWLSRLVEFVIFLPFLLPPLITGLSLLSAFQQAGLPRSLVTVICGHVLFVLALVYRLLLTRLRSIGISVVDASEDLGASGWQTFRYVIVPGLSPALVSSGVLVFALSFDETLITVFLSGDDSTLPIRLWAMIRVGFSEDINALVLVVLAFSVTMTVAIAMLLRARRGRTSEAG